MEKNKLPVWMAWVMVIAFMSLIVLLIRWEVHTKRKERQQYLRDNFSRLSTDPEVQEAYSATKSTN